MNDAYIKVISYHLPDKILTNEEIVTEFPEWTVDKINNKIGIRQRYVSGENETASDLAVKAAIRLFEEHNIPKSDIDFLIFVTQSPDYFLPTTACIIQNELGLPTSIGAYDINLGCSGFIYGLATAKALVAGGLAKNVLLLTAETYSKHINPKDKGNRTIFGDAAAATLISTRGWAEIKGFSFGTDGTGAENLIVKTGAMRHKEKMNDLLFDDFNNLKSSDYLYMDGAAILNYTLEYFPPLVNDILLKNKLQMENIDLFVFHQANKYIMNLLRRKLHIDENKFYTFYENVGNTVSSTIPIALYEAQKEQKTGTDLKIMLAAPGLGYSWGGCILQTK